MKYIAILLIILVTGLTCNAQKYMTRNGYIGFTSITPLEEIKADNNQVAAVLDATTGEMVFQVLIKSFHFEKALMEEHFNENYMESEKYPKSTFKGKINNPEAVDFSRNGIYNVTIGGELTIRDITRKIEVKGTIEVIPGGLVGNSKFSVAPEDYKIDIPGVVRDKINKNLEVNVSVKYAPVGNKQ